MKKILENKSLGYLLAAVDVLLAVVLAIIFFATYKSSVANNAVGYVPETIGIYILAGAVVEVVALMLPQYRPIHLVALGLYGASLFKEVYLIPNLIADKVNNVAFQGGNLGMNIVWILLQFIIIILGIVASFMGFLKNEDNLVKEMSLKGDTNKIIKTSICGVVAVLAIAGSITISKVLEAKLNVADGGGILISPYITEEMKQAAKEIDYDFDPNSVVIAQEEEYDFNDATLKGLSVSSNREDAHLVYYFEGTYAEGYQGDYSETYAEIKLWDDGYYAGKAKDTNFKGYWYNSSFNAKDGKKDCLNMVSSDSNYQSIITEAAGSGFYERQAYIYLNMGWGNRSMIVSGYKYYPDAAIFINPGSSKLTYTVGETFSRDSWVAHHVLKNLNSGAIFKQGEVTWNDGNRNNKVLTEAGTFDVTATWKGFSNTITITVNEAPAE